MVVCGIDPGLDRTAYAAWDGKKVIGKGILANDSLLAFPVFFKDCVYVIEKVGNYGQRVGYHIFDTIFFSGALAAVLYIQTGHPIYLLQRREVKLHLTDSARANDSQIRRALIARIGEPGTKKNPGPTYGVKADIWQALALSVTTYDMLSDERKKRNLELWRG